jgi:hypothetical protein
MDDDFDETSGPALNADEAARPEEVPSLQDRDRRIGAGESRARRAPGQWRAAGLIEQRTVA